MTAHRTSLDDQTRPWQTPQLILLADTPEEVAGGGGDGFDGETAPTSGIG